MVHGFVGSSMYMFFGFVGISRFFSEMQDMDNGSFLFTNRNGLVQVVPRLTGEMISTYMCRSKLCTTSESLTGQITTFQLLLTQVLYCRSSKKNIFLRKAYFYVQSSRQGHISK